jgi:predicted nucleic acid-binding protein
VIVLDSGALIDLLRDAPGIAELRFEVAGQELNAPALLDVELVSAVRRLAATGQMSEPRALDLLTDFDDLSIRRWPFVDVFRRRAFQIRHTVSAYDAAYVALAEALDCPLVTRDRRLARSGGHAARIVVL